MHSGDILDLEVERVVYSGRGLARVDRRVVFISGVLPGELVKVKVGRVKKGHAEADLLEILSPSVDRCKPVCRMPSGDVVPGCVYDHVRYDAEVALKQTQLAEQLQRLAGLKGVELEPPFASPKSLHYRNKITLHAVMKGSVLGYVGEDNRTIIDLEQCPLAAEPLNELLRNLREDTYFRGDLAKRADVTLRYTQSDGALFWVGKPDPSAPALTQSSAVGPLTVPRRSFFQVNDDVAEELVRYVSGIIEKEDGELIDLYCGVGVFALAAAKAGVESVLGVDNDYHAVGAAKKNAQDLGLNADFVAGASGDLAAKALSCVTLDSATVILDPPRSGVETAVLEALLSRKPKNIVYVSCAPDTLSRDTKQLLQGGYRLVSVKLFDMFPRTAHFESVMLLTKTN